MHVIDDDATHIAVRFCAELDGKTPRPQSGVLHSQTTHREVANAIFHVGLWRDCVVPYIDIEVLEGGVGA